MVSDWFTLSRSAVYAFLALLIWMALPAGIFLIVNGETTWGTLLTAAALAAIVVAVNRAWITALLHRQIPGARAGMMAFGTAVSALLTASFAASLTHLAYAPAPLVIAYPAGILLLGGWATTALLKSAREGQA
jgi:hypothetical protein